MIDIIDYILHIIHYITVYCPTTLSRDCQRGVLYSIPVCILETCVYMYIYMYVWRRHRARTGMLRRGTDWVLAYWDGNGGYLLSIYTQSPIIRLRLWGRT